MAKNKMTLQIDLESMIKSLNNVNADIKDAVNEIQIATKKVVTDALIKDTVPANFPAKGKYSTGRLAKSIDKSEEVKWSGFLSEINIGYDLKKSGITSILLLKGTPRMKKATKLYNDIYGSKIRKEIEKIQQEKLNEILRKVVE